MNEDATTALAFFYGLFMDAGLLRQKGLHPADFRLARVAGYGLRIGARATLEASAGEQVYGSVVKLSSAELRRLYSEKSVADYVPVDLRATDMDGNSLRVISYLLPMERLSGKNPEYARSLLSVAEKLGLPETYRAAIAAWI